MATPVRRICAFDIGIKNLAWCCGDLSGQAVLVRGWANENLISGGTAEEDAAGGRCHTCAHKANYWHLGTSRGYCVRHCPPLTPALRDLSGNLLKKMPKLEVLRELCKRGDSGKAEMKTKAKMLEFLAGRYCFPKAPAPKAKGQDLEGLHDGIRAMVVKNRDLFEGCTEILLENQPAFKNPVMKSVQMMLFATLRDCLHPNPTKVRFVHAGRKTTGATKGDEGYSERKGASEARVVAAFRSRILAMACGDERGPAWFAEQSKRSDLADAACMVMDALAAGAGASKNDA